MTRPIILLTDFGLQDPYVGVMKGVILSIDPEAVLVDLTHDVMPQNVVHGAYVLQSAYSYFPRGSVFVCVVDPGVGTSRKAVAVKSENYFFLAPDNGLLSGVLKREKTVSIRSLENKDYFLHGKPSATFHGRDIFAPAAAHMASHDIFEHLGPETQLSGPQTVIPEISKTKNSLTGEILFFDRFGNAVSNIKSSDAPADFWQKAVVCTGEMSLGNIRRTYADGAAELCALINSVGNLEIAFPGGSAQNKASLTAGAKVTVTI